MPPVDPSNQLYVHFLAKLNTLSIQFDEERLKNLCIQIWSEHEQQIPDSKKRGDQIKTIKLNLKEQKNVSFCRKIYDGIIKPADLPKMKATDMKDDQQKEEEKRQQEEQTKLILKGEKERQENERRRLMSTNEKTASLGCPTKEIDINDISLSSHTGRLSIKKPIVRVKSNVTDKTGDLLNQKSNTTTKLAEHVNNGKLDSSKRPRLNGQSETVKIASKTHDDDFESDNEMFPSSNQISIIKPLTPPINQTQISSKQTIAENKTNKATGVPSNSTTLSSMNKQSASNFSNWPNKDAKTVNKPQVTNKQSEIATDKPLTSRILNSANTQPSSITKNTNENNQKTNETIPSSLSTTTTASATYISRSPPTTTTLNKEPQSNKISTTTLSKTNTVSSTPDTSESSLKSTGYERQNGLRLNLPTQPTKDNNTPLANTPTAPVQSLLSPKIVPNQLESSSQVVTKTSQIISNKTNNETEPLVAPKPAQPAQKVMIRIIPSKQNQTRQSTTTVLPPPVIIASNSSQAETSAVAQISTTKPAQIEPTETTSSPTGKLTTSSTSPISAPKSSPSESSTASASSSSTNPSTSTLQINQKQPQIEPPKQTATTSSSSAISPESVTSSSTPSKILIKNINEKRLLETACASILTPPITPLPQPTPLSSTTNPLLTQSHGKLLFVHNLVKFYEFYVLSLRFI